MSNNWLHNIHIYKETPPKGVWDRIAKKLDTQNTTVAAKMQAYQVPPPNSKILQHIFAQLDTDKTCADKINQYQVVPPSFVWNNITTILDKEIAPVVNFNTKKQINNKAYFKIAIAASLMVIAASTILLKLNKKSNLIETSVASITPTPHNNINNTPQKDIKADITQPTSETKNNNNSFPTEVVAQIKINPLSTSKQKNTSEDVASMSTVSYTKGNDVASLAENPIESNNEKLQTSNGDAVIDIAMMTAPNSYINVAGPDGQMVKVSSKFSNLLNYLNEKNPDTQENLDIIINESAKWRTTFTAWRQKMTNNTLAPSFGNFMDIIELSKILENKK